MSADRKYFGTDGVRGAYGGSLINETFAARLGAAAGKWLCSLPAVCGEEPASEDVCRSRNAAARDTSDRRTGAGARPVVLIGRDTRFSGAALERALAAGFDMAGCEPVSLGILPTPAVARAVRTADAALGAVVTASHNPATDNGIKFFSARGRKLSDEEEAAIEAALSPGVPAEPSGASGARPETVRAGLDASQDYVGAATALLPAGCLRGWKVVLDTANGATVGTSPLAFARLGAEVIGLGDRPDGHNINAGVGSEHPEAMIARVRSAGARLGIGHDGDGDRCVLCDERGEVLDGDEILTLLAIRALRAGKLARETLVVTVHSNLGVDAAIRAAGGRVVRTAVGDRYVIDGMERSGATLGGESSGHIVCLEIAPTGDGLVAALKVIEAMLESGRPLSELRRALRKFPQASCAVPVRAKPPLEGLPRLREAILAAEAHLDGKGRVLVRYSGTEPKLRLLVEGPDENQVRAELEALEMAARVDLP
ncbi:MAG: phosphoglucosamine mutase [Opitutaceae bacterium]